MNWQNEKDKKAFFSLGLLALAVLLIGFTAAQVISMTRQTSPGPLLTRETLDQITNGSNTRQYLEDYQAAARELTQKNMFVPPPEGPAEPGDCTAIFGDEARIGDRWYKSGDRLGEAEVVAIGPTSVTLLWDCRRITRTPVLKMEDNSRRSSRSNSSSRNRSSGRDNQRNRSDRGGMGQGMMGRGMGGGMMGGGMGDMMGRDMGQMVRNFMEMPTEQREQHMQMMGEQFQGALEIRSSDSGRGGQNMQTMIFRRDR